MILIHKKLNEIHDWQFYSIKKDLRDQIVLSHLNISPLKTMESLQMSHILNWMTEYVYNDI